LLFLPYTQELSKENARERARRERQEKAYGDAHIKETKAKKELEEVEVREMKKRERRERETEAYVHGGK
jgi:hypothetical protein